MNDGERRYCDKACSFGVSVEFNKSFRKNIFFDFYSVIFYSLTWEYPYATICSSTTAPPPQQHSNSAPSAYYAQTFSSSTANRYGHQSVAPPSTTSSPHPISALVYAPLSVDAAPVATLSRRRGWPPRYTPQSRYTRAPVTVCRTQQCLNCCTSRIRGVIVDIRIRGDGGDGDGMVVDGPNRCSSEALLQQ